MLFKKDTQKILKNPLLLRAETWGGTSTEDKQRKKANSTVTY